MKELVKKIYKVNKKNYKDFRKRIKSFGKTKYFCIGRNKTGTTSIRRKFELLGFPIGDQRKAEILYDKYYFTGNFHPIVKYCKSAQVFQDVPFSCPETFKHLDRAYPNSKFILTIRDNPEQWYSSLVRFHTKKFGRNGNIPSVNDLKNAEYVRKGFMYNLVKLYSTGDDDPYNKEILIKHYITYNQSVIDYFKDRSNDLLIINIADKNSYERFLKFVNVKSPRKDFPWENKLNNGKE